MKPNKINYHNVNYHQKRAYANFENVAELKIFILKCRKFNEINPSIKSKNIFAKRYNVGVTMFNRAVNEPNELIRDYERVLKYKMEAEQ